jgi:hypothetical protein
MRMLQDCTHLETVLLGASFDRISGTGMFQGDTALKAVISLRANPMVCSTDNGLANSNMSNAILYVPSVEAESAYETASNYATVFAKAGSDVGTNLYRIRPILEVKGDNPYSLVAGTSYTNSMDQGTLVAGYSNRTEQNKPVFNKYGFVVSNTPLPIYRDSVGEEQLTYSLSRNVGGTPQSIMTAHRTLLFTMTDNVPPTGTITFANPLTALDGSKGTKNTTVTLLIHGEDNSGTVDKMIVMNEDTYATIASLTGTALENALASRWENYATTKANWALTAGDGRKTVYLILKDPSGNMSPVTSASIGG